MGDSTDRNPVIVSDLDGVLLDLMAPLHRWIKDTYGVATGDLDITEYAVDNVYGLRAESSAKMWEYVWASTCPEYPGAMTFLQRLCDLAPTAILTIRPLGPPYDHLCRHAHIFPEDLEAIHFAKSIEDKLKRLKLLSPAILIEDCLEIARKAQDFTNVILISRPWNKSFDLDVNYVRVGTYKAVLQEVQKALDKEARVVV